MDPHCLDLNPSTTHSSVPLAIIILGRDVLLSLAAFYIRYSSLPPPVCYQTTIECIPHFLSKKTFTRYWDFSLPSAEVRPTSISKVRPPFTLNEFGQQCLFQVNTALQLLLMGVTTVDPILPIDLTTPLVGLQ